MKLFEVKGETHSVIVKKSGKKVFVDSRDGCIRFIKAFDKASPEYVDLRLMGPKGEVDWHNLKEE